MIRRMTRWNPSFAWSDAQAMAYLAARWDQAGARRPRVVGRIRRMEGGFGFLTDCAANRENGRLLLAPAENTRVHEGVFIPPQELQRLPPKPDDVSTPLPLLSSRHWPGAKTGTIRWPAASALVRWNCCDAYRPNGACIGWRVIPPHAHRVGPPSHRSANCRMTPARHAMRWIRCKRNWQSQNHRKPRWQQNLRWRGSN